MPVTIENSMRLRTTEGSSVTLNDARLVIAGFTGRDPELVGHHIAELKEIGVPEPPSVPAYYLLDPALLSTAGRLTVDGPNTSGEVEPVIFRAANRYYLGVGSDHTDRDLERRDIAQAKAACPKPIADTVICLPDDPAAWPWDDITIECRVDGEPYQNGQVAAILPADELLTRLTDALGPLDGDLVMYAGTIPLLDGQFVPGRRWHLSLSLSDSTTLTHTYEITQRSS